MDLSSGLDSNQIQICLRVDPVPDLVLGSGLGPGLVSGLGLRLILDLSGSDRRYLRGSGVQNLVDGCKSGGY